MNIKNAKDNLYLLSFLDTVDRLDILILEVRHLQQSIIDSLHAPTLYLALRYEESYIFGGWEEKVKLKLFTPAEIAKQSIIRYPSPKDAVKYWSDHGDIKEGKTAVEKRLYDRIGEIWTGDIWVRGERQHYHSLRALQVLKQQIFRDKIHLFHEARTTGLLNNIGKKPYGLTKPAFLILRKGIHYRIERFIANLRTQQQNFGKSLDFGLQRYPRPSIDRRREIGIFNDFLTNRTLDLRADTLHLLEKVINNSEQDLLSQTPMVLHGWSQFMHVKNHQLWDNVGREYDDAYDATVVTDSVQDVSYIDTSFWSPDRPDLQPLVSKEVAISVLRNITKGFSDDYFSNEENLLTELWVSISKVLNDESKKIIGLEAIHRDSDLLVRDLVTDFVAVSSKGISYLYALYLSLVADGLEGLLKVDRVIRLEAANELEGGIGSYADYFSWYFRLKLTTFWLKRISKGEDYNSYSGVDRVVLQGIDDICEELIKFLDKHNISETRVAVGSSWRDINKKLEKVISPLKILKKVKRWKEQRSKDTWDESCKKSGKKQYHRSTMRLDVRLQNFLFRETLGHKEEKFRVLYKDGNQGEALLQSFCDAYGLNLQRVVVPYMKEHCCMQPTNIFRQLHDIPFQCAVMRSIDILGRLDDRHHKKPSWREFVKQVHSDMGLGRELFSFALEFYTWGRESPKSRLLLSINLLSFIFPLSEKKSPFQTFAEDLREELNDWMRAGTKASESLKGDINLLINEVKDATHNEIMRKYAKGKKEKGRRNCTKVAKWGAIQIDDAFTHKEINAERKRRLEQLSGYKLKELLFILEESITPIIEKLDERKKLALKLRSGGNNDKEIKKIIESLCLLGNLIEFLRIRDDSLCKIASEGIFYQKLLKAFGGEVCDKDVRTNVILPQRIYPVMVTRLALTGFYTVANLRNLGEKQNGRNKNAQGLADVLGENPWGEKAKGSSLTSVILGRYDAVNFKRAKLPCRCLVNSFPQQEEGRSKKDEAFVTHFSRREVAFPLEVFGKCEFDDEKYYLYAISSISLQRRSMRLNLLYRLLNSVSEKNNKRNFAESSVEAKLIHLLSGFNEKDDLVIKALLTDGWGDLLLVFMCHKDASVNMLHEDLIVFQQSLYEDFMVDRTELIYTPKSLDYMDFDKENYKFNFSFRFQEDRQLEGSIRQFVEGLEEKRENVPEWLKGRGDFDIVFTPGQYDVRISFHLDGDKHPKSIYQELIKWLAEPSASLNEWYRDGLSFIDKIETGIEKIK